MTAENLRAKAERVLAGTQTGRYTKRAMARDIIRLCDVWCIGSEVFHSDPACSHLDPRFVGQGNPMPVPDALREQLRPCRHCASERREP